MRTIPSPDDFPGSVPSVPDRVARREVEIADCARAAGLTVAEVAALADFAERARPAYAWTGPIPEALGRLFRPIEEALVRTEANAKARADALGIIAWEVHRRQRSYGSWTAAEWLETLGPSLRRFEQRHRVGSGCRQHLIAFGYLSGCFQDWPALQLFDRLALCRKVFGAERVDGAIQQVLDALARWGYSPSRILRVRRLLSELMLANRTPDLTALCPDVLAAQRARSPNRVQRESFFALGRALAGLGFTDHALLTAHPRIGRLSTPEPSDVVAPEWVGWCQHWSETSTLRADTRRRYCCALLRVGRWLRQTHPDVVSPEQWTRELAAEYVAAVDRLCVGQWAKANWVPARHVGKPLTARAKAAQLDPVRAFFRDCQEWGWIPRRFDPGRCLAVPATINALIAPNPRVIADDVWAKLVWAGLNLTEADLPTPPTSGRYYPVALVRAVAITWLFAGLRGDEILRLRVGCVRWESSPDETSAAAGAFPQAALCLLEVPTNKTGPAFVKPVDRVVGEAILAWQRLRPDQPASTDPKTAEMVHYLFAWRGRTIAKSYLNEHLIPQVCCKAGVPVVDARGRITTHRARSTIASQLFNAKEPLSLFELQAWLGHRTPASTQHYARITPTKLAKAYAAADYFQRNLRTVTILIDQDVVRSGAGADQPWKFYDLSHGYCTYDFFDQCPHRMACAKCSFYVPKGSSRAQVLEGKANLLRLLQEIPLTEDERAAVEEGVTAFERLLTKLADVPTPSGLTPRQLSGREIIPLRVISAPIGETAS